MLLAFWMNLYLFLSFLFIFLIDAHINSQLTYPAYFIFGLLPLLIISFKKKFNIPFFDMFFNFCLTIFFIISIIHTILAIKQTTNFAPLETLIVFPYCFCFFLIPFFIVGLLKLFKPRIPKRYQIIHVIMDIVSILNLIFAIPFYLFTYWFVIQ